MNSLSVSARGNAQIGHAPEAVAVSMILAESQCQACTFGEQVRPVSGELAQLCHGFGELIGRSAYLMSQPRGTGLDPRAKDAVRV